MADNKPQRLDKVLAHVGFGTRTEIKQLVKQGRITVGGERAKDPGAKVQPERDRIEVDGKPVTYREFIYLMMNKPQGVISATEDQYTNTVLDLLQPEHRAFEPFPAGRLDKDTEGFLLLTNDGQLAHQLLLPKKHVPKTYYARIDSQVTAADIAAFRRGVTLDGGYETLPGELTILHAGPESEIELVIYEGKFHQVKRMFEAVGMQVTYLKRIAMGPVALDPTLALGEYRELADAELALLRSRD